MLWLSFQATLRRWRAVGPVLAVALLAIGCEDPIVSDSASPSSGFVQVGPTDQTVEVGGTIKLYATGHSSSGPGPFALGGVSWSSSDESVAIVTSSRTTDPFGAQSEATILGVSEGQVSITANTGRAGRASARLSVEEVTP